jgi:hypothetical protein
MKNKVSYVTTYSTAKIDLRGAFMSEIELAFSELNHTWQKAKNNT